MPPPTNQNDILFGTTGNDVIDALAGDDQVYADLGDDLVIGGAGNDLLHGGSFLEFSTFPYAPTYGNERLFGGDGNDYIAGSGEMYGEAGNDTFEIMSYSVGLIDGGAGFDRVETQGPWRTGPTAPPASAAVTFDLTQFTFVDVERLFLNENTVYELMMNQAALDAFGRISGFTVKSQSIGYTVDVVWQGGGVADFTDKLDFPGLNFTSLGAGNLTVIGTQGKDRLATGAGNDTLRGGFGDDILDGGAGNDTLDGGSNVDTADYSAYSSAGVGVTVDLNLAGPQNTGNAGIDTLLDIENLIGAVAGANTLTGNFRNNRLVGGAGNDRLFGLTANDVLLGGHGDDLIAGGVGNDTLDGGAGNDTADYSDAVGAVTVSLSSNMNPQNTGGSGFDGVTGFENLIGGAGGDHLTGSDQVNQLEGGAGDDQLFGLARNDVLVGGAGNDLLDGGAGFDTALYAGAAAVTVNLALATAQNTGGAGMDTLTGIENLVGSDAGDSLTGNAAANRLDGGLGDDFLNGGFGNDTLFGGPGNDNLDGGVGIDAVDYTTATGPILVDLKLSGPQATGPGQGSDTFSNVERLIGSAFADRFFGNFLDNIFEGGFGNDIMYGWTGNDQIFGGGEADLIVGDGGDDLLDGGNGLDRLYGGTGNDRMLGGDDADVLFGSAGADFFDGGHGADRLYLDNASADICFIDSDFGGTDRVFGFVSGLHQLQVDPFDFGGSPGLFDFEQGSTPVPLSSRPTFLYDTDDGRLYFDADGDGAIARQLVCQLFTAANGVPALAAGDIVLVP